MANWVLQGNKHPADWAAELQDPAWNIYERVIDAGIASGIPFALGGAFGLATYTGTWRNTKDLDLFVLPRHRRRWMALIANSGLTDYYEKVPYDRRWIYRATSDGVIVDTIWAMANRRSQVDDWWFSGPDVSVHGRVVKIVPPSAMLWDKLYIMQRERCDWPDIMNLLYTQGATLEWKEVLERLEKDTPLLAGALSVFCWLSPGVARQFPEWLWDAVKLPKPGGRRAPPVKRDRAALLDTRPWYAVERRRRVA